MGFAPDRSHSFRDIALFGLCITVSVLALYAPDRYRRFSADLIRSTVLVPLLTLQRAAEESKTSRARFRAVTAERDSAAFLAQAVPNLEAENTRLRALLHLSQRISARFIPAEVLRQTQATDGRTMLLSAGRKEGVREFDPVVTPEGLLGVIRSVDANFSLVMTWAHPEFRVSAFAAGGQILGIVAPGDGSTPSETLLELRGVPYRDSVPPGTPVLSSGLGGVFPNGIPVGTVIGLAQEDEGWERSYLVRPAANPGSATHVLILTGTHDSTVASAFAPDSEP